MPPRSTVSLPFVAALALVVALASAAGQWAAKRSAREPRAEPTIATAALGPVRVGFPLEWRRLPPGKARVSGVAAGRTLVFDPAPGLAVRAVVALTPLEDTAFPSLLPKPLSRGAVGSRALQTRLDGRTAWVYLAVPRGDQETSDITVLPTTAGLISVACIGPRRTFAAVAGCASAVRLRLAGARALAPTPDLAFRLRLLDAVDRLNERRLEQRAAAGRARASQAQARAARRLAAAYDEAVRPLAPLVRGQPAAGVVTALRVSRRAYGELASSAHARDAAGYRAAIRAVEDAERRLDVALAALDRRERPRDA